MRNKYNNSTDYFRDGIPSMFVVCSPLQAMCAISAIHDFNIVEYKVLLILDEDVRNEQLFNLLNSYKIQFSVYYTYEHSWYGLYMPFRQNSPLYNRIFVGDIRNFNLLAAAFKNIANCSNIVFLDDGNDTISMLKGMEFVGSTFMKKIKVWFIKKYFESIAYIRNIKYGKFLFTLYDIPNKNYIMKKNDLSVFITPQKNKSKQGIYIVGTNFDCYCCEGFVTKEECQKQMDDLFYSLKKQFKDDIIYYIPHGRDTSIFPKALCIKHRVVYKKVDTTVELYLLGQIFAPLSIYGYTSSALINLKLMFPDTLIYDMVFDKPTKSFHGKEIALISSYYRTIGIKQLVYHT